jgi:hypothetical protein
MMYSPSLLSENNMRNTSLWLLALAVWVLSASACTLDNPEIPDLAGPSTSSRNIVVRAVPDALVSDGFSSSVVEAVLTGPNGERVSGATIVFEIVAGGHLDLEIWRPERGETGGAESKPVRGMPSPTATALPAPGTGRPSGPTRRTTRE